MLKRMGEIIFFFGSETVPCEDPFLSESEPLVIVDKYAWARNEIDKILALKQNWDGQGAVPVLSEVGETSVKLFNLPAFIDGVSDIFPNPHGTITIEWTNARKEKLSLEIGVNNYSYFVKYSDKKPKLVDGKNILIDSKAITQDLGELFSEEILDFIL